jgi:hypothetical protein
LLNNGKLENYRYYIHKNEEVKHGLAETGEQKPGEQRHIQIIVSRKDASSTIRLRPGRWQIRQQYIKTTIFSGT